MNSHMNSAAGRLEAALSADDASDRLQAALTAGTHPDTSYAGSLVARCAIEPDFNVREMLTWALTRLPIDQVMPLVVAELESPVAQARSQALHTLSKLGDDRAWASIHTGHLHDPDDEVARTAWRTAALFVPDDRIEQLAGEFASELGRGEFDVKRSLSRAFIGLGERAIPAVAGIAHDSDAPAEQAVHARATLRLFEDPEASFVLE